ncbi:hypothetical protein HMI54_012007 [Coelomomyces lativittatus]|nr:hypothetical protein HMI54_012007 [Coelomomyces lativittatus]
MTLFSAFQLPTFDPSRPSLSTLTDSNRLLSPPEVPIAIHCPQISLHPGCALFYETIPHPQTFLSYVSKYVWTVLYGCWHPPLPSPPSFLPILHFYVDLDMDGIAYTSKNEIKLSAKFIQSYQGLYLQQELQGILLHEMVHVWQFNQQAPGGLIEGIADYVRLHAGLAPPHWKLPDPTSLMKQRWDQGYEVTAFFLTWLQAQYPSLHPLLAYLNWQLAHPYTCADDLFQSLFKASIQTLWQHYCSIFK